jgi:hypothetical protein
MSGEDDTIKPIESETLEEPPSTFGCNNCTSKIEYLILFVWFFVVFIGISFVLLYLSISNKNFGMYMNGGFYDKCIICTNGNVCTTSYECKAINWMFWLGLVFLFILIAGFIKLGCILY